MNRDMIMLKECMGEREYNKLTDKEREDIIIIADLFAETFLNYYIKNYL